MKYNKYILLLLTVTFPLFFTGCEEDYAEPLVSPSVEINRIPSISQTEITVAFAPSRTVARFEYAIGNDSDKEAFLAGTYPGIVKVEDGDTREVEFPGLTKNAVYTIFARAYDANETAGPLASIKEKTRGNLVDIDAVVQFEGENSLAVTLTANTTYYKYDFALGVDSDLKDFEDGTLEGMTSREEFSTYTASYFNLQPNSEYVFFVRAYDRVSNMPTETTKINVHTVERGTVPAVECTVSSIDLYCGKYLITPNEHVGKVAIAFTLQGELDSTINDDIYWKGNILEMLKSWISANAGLVTLGYDRPFTTEFTTPSMLLGGNDPYGYPIEAFAIVYDKDEKPFAVQKFNFKTPDYDNDAKEAKVGLKISHITQNGALYEFTPNEHAIGMFFETFDADWVHEVMQSESYYDGYLELYLYYYCYWIYLNGSPVSTFPERNAEPGKKYYVFYMGINANGIEGFGPMNYQIYETLPADE